MIAGAALACAAAAAAAPPAAAAPGRSAVALPLVLSETPVTQRVSVALALTQHRDYILALEYTWNGPAAAGHGEPAFSLTVTTRGGATHTEHTFPLLASLLEPGVHACAAQFRYPAASTAAWLRISKLIGAAITIRKLEVIPCPPVAYAGSDMLKYDMWCGDNVAVTSNGLLLCSDPALGAVATCFRPIQIVSNRSYRIDIEYQWDATNAAADTDFYLDLFNVAGWDDRAFNFVPPRRLCTRGRHHYTARFDAADVPRTVCLRLVKFVPGQVRVTKLTLQSDAWLQLKDLLAALAHLAIMGLAVWLLYAALARPLARAAAWCRQRAWRERAFGVGVPALLCAAPLAAAGVFVWRFSVNMPLLDDWNFIPCIQKLHAGTLTLFDLYRFQNEHRNFFPRVATLVLAEISQYNCRFIAATIQAWFLTALAVLGICLWRQVRTAAAPYRWYALAPLGVLVFNLRQWEIMLLPFPDYLLSYAAAIAALALLHTLLTAPRRQAWYFTAAVCAAVLASFSSAAGLLVWGAGLVMLLATYYHVRGKGGLVVAWLAAGLYVWMLYWHGYKPAAQLPSVTFGGRHPLYVLEFFLTVLGGALAPTAYRALLVGGMLAALLLGTLHLAIWTRRWHENILWIALATFAGAVLYSVTVSRCEYGIGYALTSRYATFSMLIVVALYGMLLDLAVNTPERSARVLLSALLTLVLWSAPAAYTDAFARGTAYKMDQLKKAFLITTCDDLPGRVLREFHPNAALVRSGIAGLRELGYSAFAPREISAARWSAQTNLPPAVCATNAAGLAAVFSVNDQQIFQSLTLVPPATDDFLVVEGYAYDAHALTPAGGVRIEVDGTNCPVFYGVWRQDVVQRLNLADCLYAGFTSVLRASALGSGMHTLSLKVLARDQRTWWAPAPTALISVP